MRHPNRIFFTHFPNAFKQWACLVDFNIGSPKFTMMATFNLASQLMAEGLLPIANAQDWKACFKHFLRRAGAAFIRDRCRATGKNDRLRVHALEGIAGRIERNDFAINSGFTDPTRNELGNLRAEINDENCV